MQWVGKRGHLNEDFQIHIKFTSKKIHRVAFRKFETWKKKLRGQTVKQHA